MVVYYGGTMTETDRGPEYMGGAAVEATIFRDFLSYFQLIKIGTEELRYHAVERMWYVKPGLTPADGLHPIRNDKDAIAMGKAAAGGVVSLYMEVGENDSGFGDNEENIERSVAGSDPEADVSGVRADEGIVHLLDDSDRTSDPEFAEAMANLGLTGYRRKIRTQYNTDGVEVDQLNEVTANRSAQQEEIVIPDDGLHGMEFMNGRSPQGHSDADDEHSDRHSSQGSEEESEEDSTLLSSPISSYRASSRSNHDCVDKVDGEEVNSVAGVEFYDPNCDHNKLVLKPTLRFVSPQQFKEAVTNYSIAVGADINWVRSSRKCKEAVCSEPECKWRVYASWWNKDEAYIIKAVGSPQTCGRTQRIKGATAKWIAQRYMGRFRIDPELNTRHLVKEIGLTYGLEVTVRVCANARKEARRILEGTLAEQYAKMRSYVSTLQLADPDGLFALEVDPVPGTQTSKFKRLYVGFSSLRLGFLSGCRRMFALDGCFLKGEVKGMLLSAVGKDGNNQMFPIAWAVVEGENRNSWCWFVHLVKTELLIADGTGWSIISDQQKVKNLVIVELYLCNIPLTIV
ncbi:hypothetical protein LINPERHAP2_LOCUS37210 [Linum perenne]